MSLRVGSLFSGVEGFGRGLEAAGFEVAWQIEIDKDAVSVLERHYPNVRRYRDVRGVKGSELDPVDVLVGGFPCQDLSVAGARKGLAGERSGLFFEVARIAAETSTPWLLLENVDGLLSQWTPVEAPPSGVEIGTEWEVEESPDLGLVLSTLQEYGYLGCLRLLDAQYFGVAQRRERVFIVGHLGATGERACEVLLEPESVLWDLAACLQPREGDARVSDDGVAGGRVAKTLTANSGRCQVSMNYIPSITGTVSGGAHPGGLNGQDAYNGFLVAAWDERNITSAGDRARVEPGLPANTLHTLGLSIVTHALTTRSGATEDGAGRGTPRVASPDGFNVRRLMPVECERLMGWADGWTERRGNEAPIKDGPRYRMIGNGVVAPVARWIGERLRRAMEGAP